MKVSSISSNSQFTHEKYNCGKNVSSFNPAFGLNNTKIYKNGEMVTNKLMDAFYSSLQPIDRTMIKLKKAF